MTDKKLMELLVVIDDHYGRIRSKEERMADTKIYIQAFGAIPDEIVEKALYTAFTQCRYQNQLIVDWCAEVKKLLAAGLPSANDLWAQAATAAKQITANLYYMTHGGLVTSEGKLTGENFKTRNAEIFAALPVAVQRWAGSPAELSMTFGRDGADLLQFVKPGFVRAVARGVTVPLTVTRPVLRSPCTRAREKSGHCSVNQTSSRSIPVSGIVNVRISSCSAMWGKWEGGQFGFTRTPTCRRR